MQTPESTPQPVREVLSRIFTLHLAHSLMFQQAQGQPAALTQQTQLGMGYGAHGYFPLPQDTPSQFGVARRWADVTWGNQLVTHGGGRPKVAHDMRVENFSIADVFIGGLEFTDFQLIEHNTDGRIQAAYLVDPKTNEILLTATLNTMNNRFHVEPGQSLDHPLNQYDVQVTVDFRYVEVDVTAGAGPEAGVAGTCPACEHVAAAPDNPENCKVAKALLVAVEYTTLSHGELHRRLESLINSASGELYAQFRQRFVETGMMQVSVGPGGNGFRIKNTEEVVQELEQFLTDHLY